MKVDSLVSIIAQEVLKKIQESKEYSFITKKKNALILVDRADGNYEDITIDEVNIDFLDEFHDNNLDFYDYILVPSLSNKDLSSIALGLEQSKISNIIINGILRGKKIIIFDRGIEYRGFKATANPAFFNMFKEYEKKLCGFGIDVIERESLNMIIGNMSSEVIADDFESNKDNTKKLTIEKKLITEKDIYDIYNNDCTTIYLSTKSIITPLAKDFIKLNKINVICI